MIYLYGLIEAASDELAKVVTTVPGLQNPLQIAMIGPWTLIYSDHDDEEILPKRRLLLAHTKVLEALLPHGTLLPARFGLVSGSLAVVEQMILSKSALLTSEFNRVRDCLELGIRIRFPRPPALAATLAEDAELARKRDQLLKLGPDGHFALAEFGGKLADRLDRRRGVAQDQLLRKLVPLCRSHVLRRPDDDTEVLRAEFLIPAADQHTFVSAVESAALGLNFAPGHEPEIQVIGPAPMYNFVRLSLALETEDEVA